MVDSVRAKGGEVMGSNIEWTDATWNPVVGCTPVSPGCLNCYAATMARRLEAMGKAEYQPRVVDNIPARPPIRIAEVRGGRAMFTGDVRTVPDRLTDPLHWRKPRMVFVNSMSDLFHEAVPFEFIDKVFAVMAMAQHHTFQVLTKRPERMAEYLTGPGRPVDARVWSAIVDLNQKLCEIPGHVDARNVRHDGQMVPLPNVWLGTSVENQKTADERIPHLLRCPASVRFLSVEPQIAPIEYRDEWADGLHWCIGGGESGPGARPYDTAWARAGIAWTRRHGIAWFQKQLGAMPMNGAFRQQPVTGKIDSPVGGDGLRFVDRKGGDPSEWPEDLRVREFPTKGAR